jgi:Flp pilus assembly protein TadD
MQENPELLNTQAIELATEGSFQEAVACLKRAIAIEKNNYLLWFNLGITYRNAGDLYGAKQALIRAVELDNTDSEVFETLGLICYSMEDYALAYFYYCEGLEIDDTNAHIWNNLGVLHFAQENFERASEAFEKALSIYPHYYDALFNLRDTYKEMHNDTGAAICDERLKQLKPPQN